MATNYIQDGEVIDHVASGAITSGDVVVMGNIIGVALEDIADTETGPVQISGVFDLPKVTAAVIAQGEALVYDVSASKFDDGSATPAAGDVSNCCVAVEAIGAVAGNVKVKLNVGSGDVA